MEILYVLLIVISILVAGELALYVLRHVQLKRRANKKPDWRL